MSSEIFRAHFEQIWNNKDASAIERFIAPDYFGVDAEEEIVGIEGYSEHFATITAGFPDLHLSIKVIMEGGDHVAARWLGEGTHHGEFAGIPPTGKRVSMTGTAIVRVQNGLIVEFPNSDALGLLQQLGVIDASIKVGPLIF